MSDRFTKEKLEWLDAISDSGVSSGAFKLAFILGSRFLNRKKGIAWPAQETLAKACKCKTDRAIRKWVGELCAAGFLKTKRGGKGKPNTYIPTMPDWNKSSSQHQTVTGTNVPLKSEPETLTGTSVRHDRNKDVGLTGTNVPPNPLKEPFENPLRRVSAPRDGAPSRAPERAPDAPTAHDFWETLDDATRKAVKSIVQSLSESKKRQADAIFSVDSRAGVLLFLSKECGSGRLDLTPEQSNALGKACDAIPRAGGTHG